MEVDFSETKMSENFLPYYFPILSKYFFEHLSEIYLSEIFGFEIDLSEMFCN